MYGLTFIKGKWQYIFFTFSFERTLRLYITLFYWFFHILLTSTNIFWLKRFCRYACHNTTQHNTTQHNSGHAIFLSRQTLIILHSKLYSVCPSKYQDHSKPLKHLPINIWRATNTFIWLIPVLTLPKPLMRPKMYPRWRTSHYFKWKYFKN
jgi:hypothetical protein